MEMTIMTRYSLQLTAAMVSVIILLATGCGSKKSESTNDVKPEAIEVTTTVDEFRELQGGLLVKDVEIGDGRTARAGDQLDMHYTGWLYVNGEKGQKFDSSYDRHEPFGFRLGAGQVIRGWDWGVAGMQEGGTRELIIPPDLAYGSRAVGGGLIPANSTLFFEVKLVKIRNR
jgi:FKBP-type peptidyl-prolyl cis-trans isomerase